MVSLCACGGSENKLVGTWIGQDESCDSIRLLPSGTAYWNLRGFGNFYSDDWQVEVTGKDRADSGEWEVDDDRVIVSWTDDGDTTVIIFRIVDKNTLSLGGQLYKKQ